MELELQHSSFLDNSVVLRIKDEPVDFFLQHGSEGIFQPAETTSDVKDEIQDELESVDSLAPERPRKRQRVVMDMVLVPTFAEVQRKKDADDDDLTKLHKLFKPKTKKGDLILDDAILLSRLKPVGLDTFAVNLPLGPLNQMVSRHFLSSTYGGNMQATFPHPSAKKLAEHGMDDFMCLSLKYHPYAPQRPGGSGLWFNPEWYDDGDSWEDVYRVFTRDLARAIWQYMGQYEVKPTATLTLAEWLGLDRGLRQNWGKGICEMDWGGGVCARIQARKDVGPDREPTREEVMAVYHGKVWSTTPDDVVAAFDSGKERMAVWTLKCVGYDSDFQLELYDKYPKWVPPPSKKKGKPPKRVKKESEVKVETKEVKVKLKVKAKATSPESKKGKPAKGIKEEGFKVKLEEVKEQVQTVKVGVKEEEGVLFPMEAPRGKKRKRASMAGSEATNESGTVVWMKDEDEVMKVVDDEEKALLTIGMGTKSRRRL